VEGEAMRLVQPRDHHLDAIGDTVVIRVSETHDASGAGLRRVDRAVRADGHEPDAREILREVRHAESRRDSEPAIERGNAGHRIDRDERSGVGT
jgi:hypothetical protein